MRAARSTPRSSCTTTCPSRARATTRVSRAKKERGSLRWGMTRARLHETSAPRAKGDRTIPVRRAKIVATLGPASEAPETVRKLVELGVDVARLNFSHGSHDDHARVIAAIRAASRQLVRPVAILQDLQGPK